MAVCCLQVLLLVLSLPSIALGAYVPDKELHQKGNRVGGKKSYGAHFKSDRVGHTPRALYGIINAD
jgi:hypothetical protein